MTAPAQAQSDVERAEQIDALLLGVAADGDFVAQQESAAAAEAAAIGGRVRSETGDPALDPVYQAGGGEQEGFEEAEAELIENATHGEGRGDPLRDALTPEVESDAATAVYGEGDHEISTEAVTDPDPEPDDAAQGPAAAHDRGVDSEPKD